MSSGDYIKTRGKVKKLCQPNCLIVLSKHCAFLMRTTQSLLTTRGHTLELKFFLKVHRSSSGCSTSIFYINIHSVDVNVNLKVKYWTSRLRLFGSVDVLAYK